MILTIHENLFEGLTVAVKTCSKCKKSLPESYFSNASGGNYLRPECKDCGKELSKSRTALKKSAPPPPADHRCPICNRTEDQVAGEGGKKVGAWCCDHDHETGEFRDWLCHSCNRALGNMKDDPVIVKSALDYLEKHNGTQTSDSDAQVQGNAQGEIHCAGSPC